LRPAQPRRSRFSSSACLPLEVSFLSAVSLARIVTDLAWFRPSPFRSRTCRWPFHRAISQRISCPGCDGLGRTLYLVVFGTNPKNICAPGRIRTCDPRLEGQGSVPRASSPTGLRRYMDRRPLRAIEERATMDRMVKQRTRINLAQPRHERFELANVWATTTSLLR
jgi:hypothetical protein